MAAGDRDRILVDVDGDADAQLLAGEAALARLLVALGEVGVVYVGLVNPDVSRSVIRSRWPDTVASTRCRHSKAVLWVTPLSSAAHSTGTLWHEPDEGDHGGERLAAVLEGGAGEGGEPPAAAAAAPPRDPGSGGPVPPGAAGAAFRAPRVRSVGRRGPGARADADLLAAACLTDGFSEQQELVGGETRHERPEAVRSTHIEICPIRPNAHPEELSPNKDPGGRSGKFSVWPGRA